MCLENPLNSELCHSDPFMKVPCQVHSLILDQVFRQRISLLTYLKGTLLASFWF